MTAVFTMLRSAVILSTLAAAFGSPTLALASSNPSGGTTLQPTGSSQTSGGASSTGTVPTPTSSSGQTTTSSSAGPSSSGSTSGSSGSGSGSGSSTAGSSTGTTTTSTTVSGPAVTGHASGTLLTVAGRSFALVINGAQMSVLNALIQAANAVTLDDYPYVWGGGHFLAGVASVGLSGPGYNGRRIGFDCSGSVAAVLGGAGLWPAGGSVPTDAGVIAQLKAAKLIARGAASGPDSVTLYDDPGVHIFMNIGGRFFGTSDGGGGNASQPNGGAGWLSDGAYDATSRAFKRYHLLPGVLSQLTTFTKILTFNSGAARSSVATLALGARVKVAYSQAPSGLLTAQSIAAS